jgi:hypothetical protein
MAIVLDQKYWTAENEAIARLAARHGVEGAGYTFIRNGRTLREFEAYLRRERLFNRSFFRRGSWYSPL